MFQYILLTSTQTSKHVSFHGICCEKFPATSPQKPKQYALSLTLAFGDTTNTAVSNSTAPSGTVTVSAAV